ncbi:MAG: hypothetical protein IJL15_02565 [Clostridia bacterium]|nr:hypothetical protein [Clostridia bacterium]
MKEFLILERRKEKTYQTIEALLEEKSSQGWEVVSVSIDLSSDLRGTVLIVLQREKETANL